jgi:hypothetical protein
MHMSELCVVCWEPTGRAGFHEDSIGYLDHRIGPLCPKCDDKLYAELLSRQTCAAATEQKPELNRVSGINLELADALRDLFDCQNGPPLYCDAPRWQAAMFPRPSPWAGRN